MSAKEIFTVFGATGNQGGSIINVFLSDPELKEKWALRAVTRDVNKDSAKKLAERGVEVVAGDLDDKESVSKAVQGSHTVFGATDYWAYLDAKKEIQQGKNIADAAKEAGVKHLIWSTLRDINKLSNGVLPNVYHFDGKAAVAEYIRSLGIPATFFLPGVFLSSVTTGMLSRNPETGNFAFVSPTPESAILPLFDPAADTGKFVRGIVKAGPTGKEVLASSGYRTMGEVLEVFKKQYPEEGSKAAFVQLPHDIYKNILIEKVGFPDFVAQEMLENMRLFDEFGYFAGDSLDESIALAGGKEGLTSLEEFIKTTPTFKDLK